MYFKPFILPRWALHHPDCNDYNGVLHWHNYIMRGTDWRSGKGGRSIRATNNQLAAMYVRRQRAINAHDLPNGSGASSSGDEPAAAQPAHRCGDRPPINDLNQARRQRPRARSISLPLSLIPSANPVFLNTIHFMFRFINNYTNGSLVSPTSQ
jgi:hypothetical protein